MTEFSRQVRKVAHRADELTTDIVHSKRDWIERFARFGYATKGVVYLLVGLLAVQVVLGRGGEMTDTSGALQTIAEQPFGKLLLAVAVIGLVCYVLWRLVQGLLNPEHKGGESWQNLGMRAVYLISAVAYSAVALAGVRILAGRPEQPDAVQSWSGKFMEHPLGRPLLFAVSAVLVGYGVYQINKGIAQKFRKKLDMYEVDEPLHTWLINIARFGLVMRGVAFMIIGWMLTQATLHHNSQEAGGLDEALAKLAAQPYGPWLLGAMALGLIGYGIYQLLEARFRVIRVS